VAGFCERVDELSGCIVGGKFSSLEIVCFMLLVTWLVRSLISWLVGWVVR
jgi:hypothetical protein